LNWKIDCLYFGKMNALKSESTPGFDTNLKLWLPILGFLLRNGKRNILVDTGVGSRMCPNGKFCGVLPAEGGEKFVIESLKRINVACDDIDTVIYTHLHADHAGNHFLFPKAKHIVQKDEWKELQEPLEYFMAMGRFTYDFKIIQEFKELMSVSVNGNFQLDEGIMCYQVPGHTLGCMALTVNTTAGMYVISSDLVNLKCNLYPQMETMLDIEGREIKITPAPKNIGPAIPSFIINDYYNWLNSVRLLQAMCAGPDYLLTSHDPSLVNKSFY